MPLTGDHRIVPVIRSQLTQNIGNLFGQYFEEITEGCDEFIENKFDGKFFFLLSFLLPESAGDRNTYLTTL